MQEVRVCDKLEPIRYTLLRHECLYILTVARSSLEAGGRGGGIGTMVPLESIFVIPTFDRRFADRIDI